MKWILLSSASTKEDLSEAIKRFYCGEEKVILHDMVVGQRGNVLEGVRVKQRGSRWRFEMLMGDD
jgi:hypothetical protein